MRKTPSLAALFAAWCLMAPLPAAAKPDHVVMGYSAWWLDDVLPPEAYNYGALTHIARSFLKTDPEGHITVPGRYFNPALTRLAHEAGVKVLASIGGWTDSSANWVSMATHPEYEKRFFVELERLIGDHRFDGVDIDWEPGAQGDAERKAFTSFMRDLRSRFPHWTLTTAVMVEEQYAAHMDWKEVAGCVDYVGLMTYDFAGVFSHYAYHHANLYSDPSSKAENGISVDETVRRVMDKYGVGKDKLLVGLPFFGKTFQVDHWNDPLTAAMEQVSSLSYSQVVPLAQGGDYSERWDEKAQSPYLQKKEGPGLVSYDTPRSIDLKCAYVRDRGLPGVLIWVLGSDLAGDSTPLMDRVALAFGSGEKAIPLSVLLKMETSAAAAARSFRDQLEELSRKLSEAGLLKEASDARPGPFPGEGPAGETDRAKLVGHLKALQAFLAHSRRQVQAAAKALGIPEP